MNDSEKIKSFVEKLMAYCPEHGSVLEKICDFIDSLHKVPVAKCPKTPPNTHPSGLGGFERNHPVIRLIAVRLAFEAELLHRHSQMNLRAVIVLD